MPDGAQRVKIAEGFLSEGSFVLDCCVSSAVSKTSIKKSTRD